MSSIKIYHRLTIHNELVGDSVWAEKIPTPATFVGWGCERRGDGVEGRKANGPRDLVFQSVRNGGPMRDGNILRRHLRPAAVKLGIDPKKATWRSLRTSCATWMVQAGANPKDVQGQMRHARISTTMDIYAQHVPESQRIAVAKMMAMVDARASSRSVN